MPRGVYDRSKAKPRGTAAASAPVAKAPKVIAKSAVKATKAKTTTTVHVGHTNIAPERNAILDFQILGANISTLSDVYAAIGSTNTDLGKLVSAEITATLAAITSLRESVFPTTVATEEEAPASKKAAATLPQAPSLPQASNTGTAAFVPPAPPTLPQH